MSNMLSKLSLPLVHNSIDGVREMLEMFAIGSMSRLAAN